MLDLQEFKKEDAATAAANSDCHLGRRCDSRFRHRTAASAGAQRNVLSCGGHSQKKRKKVPGETDSPPERLAPGLYGRLCLSQPLPHRGPGKQEAQRPGQGQLAVGAFFKNFSFLGGLSSGGGTSFVGGGKGCRTPAWKWSGRNSSATVSCMMGLFRYLSSCACSP